jgi:tetratricopeptide (TPR) repeat protein
MTPTAEMFTTGWQLHQSGDLVRAEQAYRQVLEQEPENAQAWYLLGALCEARGDLPAAASSLDQALRLRPAFAAALHHRGIVCTRQNELVEATDLFRRALCIRPGDMDIQTDLALALLPQEKTQLLDEAVALLQVVLQQRPNDTRARTHLHEALAFRARAEGVYYLEKRNLDLAAARLQEALRIRPDFPYVHYHLGNTLSLQGKREEAIPYYQQALRLRPDLAHGSSKLAQVLYELGRFDEALAHSGQALRAKPDLAVLGRSAVFVMLLLQRREKDQPEYSWSWPNPTCPLRRDPQPRWDGSPQPGRTILLHGEGGGLGDTLQFIRYARLVKEQGATVVLASEKPLLRLLDGCPGIDRIVAQGDPLPPHDFSAPLASLPYVFRSRADTIPARVPYLRADPELVEQWRRELTAPPGFKIGIAWQGGTLADRQGRSIPFAYFAPLAAVPGVQLVSLQKGAGSEHAARAASRWPLTDLSARLDETAGPFMDTAAVMMNLDLVVTADTAIAHLAGALGVPVWVVLPSVPDWRWFLGQDDCPWYPTMRLFRQERQGEWEPVFQRIIHALKQHMEMGPQDSGRSGTTCPVAEATPRVSGLSRYRELFLAGLRRSLGS